MAKITVAKNGQFDANATMDKLASVVESARDELAVFVNEGMPTPFLVDAATKKRAMTAFGDISKWFGADPATIGGRGRQAKVWDIVRAQQLLSDTLRDHRGLTKGQTLTKVVSDYNATLTDFADWIDASFLARAIKEEKIKLVPSASVLETVPATSEETEPATTV